MTEQWVKCDASTQETFNLVTVCLDTWYLHIPLHQAQNLSIILDSFSFIFSWTPDLTNATSFLFSHTSMLQVQLFVTPLLQQHCLQTWSLPLSPIPATLPARQTWCYEDLSSKTVLLIIKGCLIHSCWYQDSYIQMPLFTASLISISLVSYTPRHQSYLIIWLSRICPAISCPDHGI